MVSQDKEIISQLTTLQEQFEVLEVEVRATRNNFKNNNKMLADLLLRLSQSEKKVEANEKRLDNHFVAFRKLDNTSRTWITKLHEVHEHVSNLCQYKNWDM